MLGRSEKNHNNNNYSNNNDNNNDDDKKTNHTLPFTKSVDEKISSSNVLFALRGVPAKAFKPWPTSTNIIHLSSIISLP